MRQLDELVDLLDRQARHLQAKLAVLRRMAECVRHGDVKGLDAVLAEQTGLIEVEGGLDQQMGSARAQVAEALGLPLEQATLGRLVETLDGPAAMALGDRRERLLTLIAEIRRASSSLNQLVRHAMELNRQVLAAVSGTEHEGRTYSRTGTARQNDALSTFGRTV